MKRHNEQQGHDRAKRSYQPQPHHHHHHRHHHHEDGGSDDEEHETQQQQRQQQLQPRSLVESCTEALVEHVERTDGLNVEWLKRTLPNSLYHQVRDKLVHRFINGAPYSSMTNFRRLLSQKLIDKYIPYYLDLIIENEMNDVDLCEIRDNVSESVFLEFLERFVNISQDNWDMALESLFGISENALFYEWDTRRLNDQQLVMIRNYPERTPELCDDRTSIIVIARKLTSSWQRFCDNCFRDQDSIKVTEVYRIHCEDFVDMVLRNPSMWCYNCKRCALFNILDQDEIFVNYSM